MPGEQITCREFVRFVGDYRDSELPAAETAALDEAATVAMESSHD